MKDERDWIPGTTDPVVWRSVSSGVFRAAAVTSTNDLYVWGQSTDGALGSGPDVTLLTDGPAQLEESELDQLRAAGVAIDERPVARLEGPGDELSAVVFDDGSERVCGGLLVAVTMHQRSSLATQLGATSAPPNPLAEDSLVIDAMHQTTAPGVFAAGDTSVHMPSVANAIAAGSNAAAMIVRSIVESTYAVAPASR